MAYEVNQTMNGDGYQTTKTTISNCHFSRIKIHASNVAFGFSSFFFAFLVSKIVVYSFVRCCVPFQHQNQNVIKRIMQSSCVWYSYWLWRIVNMRNDDGMSARQCFSKRKRETKNEKNCFFGYILPSEPEPAPYTQCVCVAVEQIEEFTVTENGSRYETTNVLNTIYSTISSISAEMEREQQ